jgi:hypothetical protein
VRQLLFAVTFLLSLSLPQSESPSLPNGYSVRDVKQTDTETIHALCPLVKWDQVFFPCYQSDWAVWAVNAEKTDLETLTPALLRTFRHQNTLTDPITAVVTFPDGTVFITATASLKGGPDGAVIVWIVNPVKRTMDVIWEHEGKRIYMGPNATFLSNHHIVPDMFVREPGAAPTG